MALPSNPHLINNFFFGMCRHEYVIPPAFMTVMWFIDYDNVNGVTGLFSLPTASHPFPPGRTPNRGKILDNGLSMEGRGTDATILVPHCPIPPIPSPMLLLIILLGSSKIIMGSNKTRIWCHGMLEGNEDQAVGCCIFPYIPISLNLQCWDQKCKTFDVTIGAPMLSDIVIAPNSVQVGINFADFLAAMIDWAIDVAIAIFLAFGMKAGKAGWSKVSSGPEAAKLDNATGIAKEAYEKEFEKGMKRGLEGDACDRLAQDEFDKVFEKETGRFVPGLAQETMEKQISRKWLIGLGLRLPWRCVSHMSWFVAIKKKA